MDRYYYNGNRLLSMKDSRRRKPFIYIVESNRDDGKTTYFVRKLVNDYLNCGKKFVKLTRFRTNLDDGADKMLGKVLPKFYDGLSYDYEISSDKLYGKVYINGEFCGFILPISGAAAIKDSWQLFTGTSHMFLDEFQSETNEYVKDETTKLISIQKSLSKQCDSPDHYLPLYMAGNLITLLNPYYIDMGISDRIQTNTKFLKGDGYVLERHYNETAAHEAEDNGFLRAFSRNKYVTQMTEQIYLNDTNTFIERPAGRREYIASIRNGGQDYAVYLCYDAGVVYCSQEVDYSFPRKIAITTEDQKINYVILKNSSNFISLMRWYFQNGCFRFRNMKCKSTIFKLLCFRG